LTSRPSGSVGWSPTPEAHNPGVRGGWDTYACCKQPGVNDVAFIAALIDELMRSEGIDNDTASRSDLPSRVAALALRSPRRCVGSSAADCRALG
jgi:hypothetical protein